MKFRTAFAAWVLATGMAVAAPEPEPAVTDPGHLVSPASASKGAVSRQQFEARIEAVAADLRTRVPGVKTDRYTEFDLAWPADAAEWRALHGNAVLVIAAFAQDGSELPLAKLYLVHADGSQVALRRIGAVRRELPKGSKSGAVFGSNLSEEFYLLPSGTLDARTQLLCDFAKSRRGFVVTERLASPPAFAGQKAPAGPPPLPTVKALVAREFPGFGATFTDGGK